MTTDEAKLVEVASRYFLHTPAESTTNYVKWAEELQRSVGIQFGCILDRHIIPLHPGDLMAVVSRPGQGKSSIMAYLARKTAREIVKREKQGEECVVYVSWEQPVEELEAFFQSGEEYSSTDLAWGKVDIEAVKRQAIKRPSLPVWMIGYSIADAKNKKPPMSVDMVYGAIRGMFEIYGLKPVLICLDYLQIIPVSRARERTEQVENATIEAKHLGMDVGCPIIAGVQARREVDKYKNPIPTLSDAQHSSAIEQTADKQIALWRPWKSEENKAEEEKEKSILVGKHRFDITPELLVVRLLKQRLDVGGGTWAVHFKPQTLELNDIDVYHDLPPWKR